MVEASSIALMILMILKLVIALMYSKVYVAVPTRETQVVLSLTWFNTVGVILLGGLQLIKPDMLPSLYPLILLMCTQFSELVNTLLLQQDVPKSDSADYQFVNTVNMLSIIVNIIYLGMFVYLLKRTTTNIHIVGYPKLPKLPTFRRSSRVQPVAPQVAQ